MEAIEYLGYIAAITGCTSLIPEVIRAHRTRHLRDVAWGMLTLMLISSSLWLIYGLIENVPPLIFSSSVHVTLQSVLIIQKYVYSRRAIQAPPQPALEEIPATTELPN